MDKEHTVREKSYRFAIRIVKLYVWLKEQHHYELSSQVLRAGTSIGPNIEEAAASHSKKEFFHKMGISSKEARETHYWLRLLRDSGILTQKQTSDLINDAEELIKMLTSIVKTGRSNLRQLITQNYCIGISQDSYGFCQNGT
ncbi:MAG: four helix bundle protein [Deltaproteobacteria bacterium]|nr:four helix bundle protein [Deltaproteobacteria bacterium]